MQGAEVSQRYLVVPSKCVPLGHLFPSTSSDLLDVVCSYHSPPPTSSTYLQYMPRAAPQPRPQPRISRQTRLAHLGYGSNNCANEFLRHFTNTQNQQQQQRSKKQLTAQQHAALRENADRVVSITPAWADNTKHNIAGILEKWERYVHVHGIRSKFPLTHVLHRYCETMKLGDWESVLKTAQKGTAMYFL
jgi:hypothetical protein